MESEKCDLNVSLNEEIRDSSFVFVPDQERATLLNADIVDIEQTKITKESWGDKIFFDNFLAPSRRKSRASDSSAKIAVLRAAHWYVGASLADCNLVDLYLTLMSKTKFAGNDHLIPDALFDEASGLTVGDALGVQPVDEDPIYECKQTDKDATDVKKEVVAQFLTRLSTMAADPKDLPKAINVMTTLLLIMLRAVVKNPSNPVAAITKTSEQKIANFFQCFVDVTIPPPSDAVWKNIRAFFPRQSPNCRVVFSWVVGSWMIWTNTQANSVPVSYLNACCLTSLSYTGLTALDWYFKAETRFPSILKELTNEEFRISVSRIVQFSNWAVDRKQQTWPWCRLFYERALEELSGRANPEFTLVCYCLVKGENATSEFKDFRAVSRLVGKVNDMKRYQQMAKVISRRKSEKDVEEIIRHLRLLSSSKDKDDETHQQPSPMDSSEEYEYY